ncbi:MAG: nucleotide-binding universal stress UspA family protein [Glaciecola sp.]|jgi:nucleotide-binding universal stress UspA family protein
MNSYTAVFVGTDGSVTAQLAVAAASAVARALQARLTIVTAFERGMFEDAPPTIAATFPDGIEAGMEAAWARDVSVDAAAGARAAGIDARQATVPLSPAKALDELAGDKPGSLIVVGTRGLSEATERIVGNVPHELSHHAHSDVLMVTTTDGARTDGWQTVALGTDGSPTAIEACRGGLALAVALGATVTLLTAAAEQDAGEDALTRTAIALGRDDLDGRVVITEGDPGAAVAEAGADYDMLVMGNKGMSGIRRLLGSVPNTVTHRVPTDLLLVNTTRS